MENPDESKQQTEPCKQKKRGRPPLEEGVRVQRKIARSKKYRDDQKKETEKKDEALKKKDEELKKKDEEQKKKDAAHALERKSLNEELSKARDQLKQQAEASSEARDQLKQQAEASSEIYARTDKLGREMRDQSKKVKMAGKGLESGMQQLQQKFLDSDDQKDRAENSKFDIPMDYKYLNNLDLGNWDDLDLGNWDDLDLGNFDLLDSQSSKTRGENMNVILEENSPMIQKIFSQYPNIASSFQVQRQSLKDCFMNTLAEVYKMTMEDKHTLEQIKSMEEGIKDLELAGLEIQWLKNLVNICREVFKKGKN